MSLKLSVVIVTYNRCNDLKECIDSIFGMKELPHEVIIVNSFSNDGTDKLVRGYPVKYIRIPERSMVRARNVGLRRATGDIVAYIDDDVVVSRNWSIHILESYKSENIGGVGGRVIPYNINRESRLFANKYEIGKVLDNGIVFGNFDILTSTPMDVDTLIGCNMSFRRKLLMRIGGFDEKFKGNCFREDTDICIRLKRLGYRLIYNPKALVWHKFRGKNLKSSWYYWTVYNQTYFFFKNFRPITMRKLFAFLYALFPYSHYDYVKKSGVTFKLNPLTITYALLGLISGIYALKGDPI